MKPAMSAIIEENIIVRKNLDGDGKSKSTLFGISKLHHRKGRSKHGVVTSKLNNEYLMDRHFSLSHSFGSDSQGHGSLVAL